MGLILVSMSSLMLFLLFYKMFEYDFFSPTVLFTGSYFISSVCCLYNVKEWGVNLRIKTILLILIAILTFASVEYLIRKIVRRKVKYKLNYNNVKVINIKKRKILIVIIINFIITVLLYKEVVRIANLNYQDWGNLIYNFKTNSGNNGLEGASLNSLVSQTLKLSKAFAYIFLFIFINNAFAKKNIRKLDWIYLIPIIFVVIQSLLKGVRIAILTIIISGAFIGYFFMQYEQVWKLKIGIKKIVKVFIISSVICVSFYQVKDLVGRQQEDIGVVRYATTYLGGNIQLLDQYLRDDIKYKGNESFSGLISSLQKIGLFKNTEVSEGMEYRTTSTGKNIGNVYGAVRNYYNDYGIGGVIICFFIMSAILNSIYYSLKIRSYYYIKNPFLLIFYSTLVYGIIFLTFYDFIFPKLAIGGIMEILLLWICKKYILDINIKVKV